MQFPQQNVDLPDCQENWEKATAFLNNASNTRLSKQYYSELTIASAAAALSFEYPLATGIDGDLHIGYQVFLKGSFATATNSVAIQFRVNGANFNGLENRHGGYRTGGADGHALDAGFTGDVSTALTGFYLGTNDFNQPGDINCTASIYTKVGHLRYCNSLFNNLSATTSANRLTATISTAMIDTTTPITSASIVISSAANCQFDGDVIVKSMRY